MRMTIVAIAAAGFAILPVAGKHIRVIDGDTITVNGKTIRLVGFIAPEKREAQCDST